MVGAESLAGREVPLLEEADDRGQLVVQVRVPRREPALSGRRAGADPAAAAVGQYEDVAVPAEDGRDVDVAALLKEDAHCLPSSADWPGFQAVIGVADPVEEAARVPLVSQATLRR